MCYRDCNRLYLFIILQIYKDHLTVNDVFKRMTLNGLHYHFGCRHSFMRFLPTLGVLFTG